MRLGRSVICARIIVLIAGRTLKLRTIPAAIVIAIVLFASAARAQSTSGAGASATAGANSAVGSDAGPVAGGHELEIWSGGGPSISGGFPGLGVWNAGVRYGWVLTGLHGPSFLRGRFETGVDFAPIFWVLQPGGTAYGFAIVPSVLKWDFAERRGVVPYFDLDGSVLLTSRDTPPHISRVNFTPSAAIGLHFLRHKYAWTAEFRFLHVSDAGLTDPNPGINTVEVRMGFGFFTHPK
jgi:hypothetical protein